MKRRDFITLVGGTAATWPLAAHAQQRAMPIVGLLCGRTSVAGADNVASVRKGLRQAGHVEGRNITIEYRWAEGRARRPADARLKSFSAMRRVIGATPKKRPGLRPSTPEVKG